MTMTISEDRPYMIAVEGADGVGKTTLASKLTDYLQEELNLKVHGPIKSPSTSTYLGQIIRKFLADELQIVNNKLTADPDIEAIVFQALNAANLHATYQQITETHDTQKADVWLFDRWSLSTLAYGRATEANEVTLEQLVNSVPEADTTIILSCDTDEVRKRMKRRRRTDRFEQNSTLVSTIHKIYKRIEEELKLEKNRFGQPRVLTFNSGELDEEKLTNQVNEAIKQTIRRVQYQSSEMW